MLGKEIKTLTGNPFRKFYRAKTRNNIKGRLADYQNDRIIRLFVEKLKDKIIETPSGVHIERMGYFYVHMVPFNTLWGYKGMKLNRYHLTFIPTYRSIFKYWMMDFHFCRTMNKRLKERIKEGYRYLNLVQGISRKDYYYLGTRSAIYGQHLINKQEDEIQ